MAITAEAATERTALLYQVANERRLSQLQSEQDEEAQSIISSVVAKEEQQMGASTVGERLPYNDYTTIDWLHDLAKDSYRFRYIQSGRGLRYTLLSMFDACSGWIAAVAIGALTACVAFVVDVAVATVSDWKLGYCTRNPFLSREACCENKTPLLAMGAELADQCPNFHVWTSNYGASFVIYVVSALLFGTISSSATMLSKASLPSASSSNEPDEYPHKNNSTNPNATNGSTPPPAPPPPTQSGKVMYMASGSGIPELKTLLSGFTIPNFLTPTVLLIKAFGAIFAVSTGMCLGKEGPFVHISTCVGRTIGSFFPKYANNGRKMRELLSAACASGLSVAFGAPIGGVLFSYEEISTYFPRNVLWRAFLCSLSAAIILKALNPTGTGKLVLFETNYGTSYEAVHYLVFILLGIAGGIFGGLFCKLNFLWSKWFRAFGIIKRNPVLEVFLVVLATTLLQFPNPMTRETGDVVIKNLLVDCKGKEAAKSWVCRHEEGAGGVNWVYTGYLIYGTLTKLVLTIITFGIKVPSGVIIPALDAGALFGRLIGQLIPSISPGIFAMVGAASFLAGVSRMTISLAVIMFELTGQLEYVLPHMLAILVSKWVADAISSEGVYDLAQTVLGHPFLDPDAALRTARRQKLLVGALIPPKRTMEEITVKLPAGGNCVVAESVLRGKVEALKRRGLMDAGVVVVRDVGVASAPATTTSTTDTAAAATSPTTHPPSLPILQAYISQPELEFGLQTLCPPPLPPSPSSSSSLTPPPPHRPDFQIRLLSHPADPDPSPETLEIDLSPFVDKTPLSICASAPLEYAVEMFSRLGLRYLCVTEAGTGALVGVVIKKRLVGFLEGLGG